MGPFSRRPLNEMENLFASNNIRFAVLLAMNDGETTCKITKQQAEDAIEETLQQTQIGHHELHRDIVPNIAAQGTYDSEWSLDQMRHPSSKIHSINNISLSVKNRQILHTLLENDNPVSGAAEGPLKIHLVLNEGKESSSSSSQKKTVRAIVVNGNHAMVDGRSLVGLTESIAKHLQDNKMHYSPNYYRVHLFPDWQDLLLDHPFENEPGWNSTPRYLAPSDNVLNLSDLPSTDDEDNNNQKDSSFGLTTPSNVLMAWKELLKSQQGKSISMTALLVELLMHSLSQEASPETTRNLNVSVLVDLRPYLKHYSDYLQQYSDLPLAIATITLSLPSTSFDNKDCLQVHLERAKTLTKQLHTCMERGEHIRCGRALTSGKFEQASPPATMELSNLGVIDIPSSMSMYTAQRYDDYDGISCMTHTEKGSGIMRWEVGVGKNMPVDRVKGIFQRAVDIMAALVEKGKA